MTHGEAWFQEESSMELIKGEWVVTDPAGKIPPPLPRKDAVRYYNSKLFDYWLEKLDERIPVKRREKALSLMMFGNPEYKKYVNREI